MVAAIASQTAQAQSQPADPATRRNEIERLLREAETPTPGATRGEALRLESNRYETVARAIEAFLKDFPNDPSADRFIVARLQAIYWTATARGHELDPIEEEINRIDIEKARPAVRVAVSYWKARLTRDRLVREMVARGEEPPLVGPAARLEEFQGSSQRVEDEHARRYPNSPSAAAICGLRAMQALERQDTEQAALWIDMLAKNHPNDAMLDSLKGELRLRESIGRVWAPDLITVDQRPVDWAAVRGKITLVVFWSPRFRPSVTLLRRVLAVVGEHPSDAAILVVGIDDDPVGARTTLSELGFTGPIVHDGMGWRSPIARAIGIRVLPTVLFLDREGRLMAIERLGRRQLSAEVVARLKRIIDSSPTTDSADSQPTESDDGIPLSD